VNRELVRQHSLKNCCSVAGGSESLGGAAGFWEFPIASIGLCKYKYHDFRPGLLPSSLNMLVYPDHIFNFQDVRKSLKLIGRAYQHLSVAMIELCRLFLELSRGSWDQVFALKRFNQFLSLCVDNPPFSLVYAIGKAVERAVNAETSRMRTPTMRLLLRKKD
jgi:hypothetical protein